MACGKITEEMKMEDKLKVKVEELKPLSAKKIEMEWRVRFLKAEIEAKAESLEERVVAALVEKGELEVEVLVKKRECDFVKEEEISITTPAGPAASPAVSLVTSVTMPTTPTWAKVLRHKHLHHHIGIT